jgi:rod shape-determining protein MreD
VTAGAAIRGTGLVFVAALFQAGLFASLAVVGGTPDLLLITVISLGLLRGSVPGAIFGFFGGLVLDLSTLETLGVTSLVLTLVGFWAGRYAETTGRGRRLAPLVAVGVLTVLAGVFGFALHYMLGEDVVARHALVTALAPALVLNLVLALPVYALVRAVVGEPRGNEPAAEVELVV